MIIVKQESFLIPRFSQNLIHNIIAILHLIQSIIIYYTTYIFFLIYIYIFILVVHIDQLGLGMANIHFYPNKDGYTIWRYLALYK